MSVRHRFVTWFTASYFAALAVLPSSLSAGDFIKSVFKGPSVTTKEPCVERLAQEIDWLERHIDQYGSVVAKQPDVWGQARLTKHRDELEKQLFAQLNQFHVYLNGTLNRADQAFLANAFSLSASLGGSAQQPTHVQATTMAGTPAQPIIQKFEAGHFITQGDGEIALEPVVALDQLNRYINHLHELRRINEGDDTADSPGYSLNLVRIPVSVLPGRATNEGYGAEITITATPYLNDGLLPVTFRSLVVNDIVDQLALPTTKISDDRLWEKDTDGRAKLKKAETAFCSAQQQLTQLRRELQQGDQQAIADASQVDPENARKIVDDEKKKLAAAYDDARRNKPLTASAVDVVQQFSQQYSDSKYPTLVNLVTLPDRIDVLETSTSNLAADVERLQSEINTLQQSIAIVVGPSSRTRNAQNPVAPSALVPVFGDEELLSIAKSFTLGYEKRDVRWNDEPKKIVHLPDVQRFLQSELHAAYQCLARPEYQEIWERLPSGFGHANDIGGIVTAIRRGDACQMEAIRSQFISDFRSIGQRLVPTEIQCPVTTLEPTCLEALAWALLAESALLDAHLKGDMTSVAQLRGCGCGENCHLRFYMPDPGIEERQAFQEYVRCRWPIHVFALDPVTQDQNIGDAATIRRELQLAVSLAFVGGKMSASNFTKFTRQFEAQFETIALNRTVVGFSHGDDTFGWRFYPRFQTPPTKGNIAAFHETLWGKHKDCDLLNRKIEPGMRECVAVVIMPSFVPYVTFDVRSNWFRLNHHHGLLPSRDQAEPSMTDTMKLSRAVQQMHHTAACIRDANCYRGADVHLLMNRVHQLDRELPLQTMTAQVPIENTLGGFEMFSNGVTDLAPDLYGWYGGPGVFEEVAVTARDCTTTASTINGLGGVPVQPPTNICPCGIKGTTLFLVGDHFSVHDTKVIAGDQCISDVSLLSRQIMRITVPENLKPNKLDGVEYIDVHVATPYGVTSHLHIPYIRKPKAAAAATAADWKWIGPTEFEACINFDLCFNPALCGVVAPPVDKLRAVLLNASAEFPAGGAPLVGGLVFIPLDAEGKELSTGATITGLQFVVDSHEQGVFTNLSQAMWETAIQKSVQGFENVKSVKVRALVGVQRPTQTFDKELTIKLRINKTNTACALPAPAAQGMPTPAPALQLPVPEPRQEERVPPPAPRPQRIMPMQDGGVLGTVAPEDRAALDAALLLERSQAISAAEAAAASNAVSVAASATSSEATSPPPATAVPSFNTIPVVSLPQTPGAVTTIMQGIPVTGQPVPVPVLVPALPAPAQPVTPAPQRHPCPCKSLRFAVPGCETSEAFPGDDLSAAPPLRNLRRMLGWAPSHRGGEPRFLDPQLVPAAYMQPLPKVHSN